MTLLQLLLGLGLALLLNAKLPLTGLTRVLAPIPWAMPPVVVAIMSAFPQEVTHSEVRTSQKRVALQH